MVGAAMAVPSREKRRGKRGEGSAVPPRARRGAGEAAVTSQQITVESGNHASRENVTGSGSPVMRPKTLPNSGCDSGKASREPNPPVQRRVKTHTATRRIARPRFLGDGVSGVRE